MWKRLGIALALLVAAAQPVTAADPELVVLHDTGRVQDGLPVMERDPAASAAASQLTQGFSGRLVRLYHHVQTYLQTQSGATPQPAYLAWTQNEGGFPRFGLVLDGKPQPDVGYVDLNARQSTRLTGDLGTADQIFPHELGHIIYRQLAGPGEPQLGGRVHAVAVKTDGATALDEGFGESLQVMAIDDPGADPATRRAAANPQNLADVKTSFRLYQRAVEARWGPGDRSRLGFLLYSSGVDQILRYQGVKENWFARQPTIPDRLHRAGGSYEAFLLENVLPGEPGAPPKTAGEMLATEGVVAHLLLRWVTSPDIQNAYRDDAFYARFGLEKAAVAPLENGYLKLFHTFYTRKPRDASQLIEAYKAEFPDDAAAVAAVVNEALLGQPVPVAGPVWLVNPDFQSSIGPYDQFRGWPIPHLFDLNAASPNDLLTVPGVTPALAEAIRTRGPYTSAADLERVPGMSPVLQRRFTDMAGGDPRGALNSALDGRPFGLGLILRPYLWRALWVFLAAALCGALLYRRFQPGVRWWRAVFCGLAAAFFGLGITWFTGMMNHGGLAVGPEGLLALVVVVILCGLPAAGIRLFKRQGLKSAGLAILAWLAATVPAAILVHPWF